MTGKTPGKKRPSRLWQPADAVKALMIRRHGIGDRQRPTGGGVGADGGPIHKIGRGLEDVGVAGQAQESKLESPAGDHTGRGEQEGGINDVQRAGGHAVA